MAAAPHPIVCPAFYDIGIDIEDCLGEKGGASKVQLVEGGIFFLENCVLKCKRHQMDVITLSEGVWDIDYDDNMLMALQHDGSLVAWKGDVESYGSELQDIDSLSRKLFVFPGLARLNSPHILCLRGDVGVVCVISHSTLHLVKIESDLSIYLSHSLGIGDKEKTNFTETVSDCRIWGTDVLFVAYTVLGNAVTIHSIDLGDREHPCKLSLVHHQESWVTALSNGQCPIFASGDSVGTICFFAASTAGERESQSAAATLLFTAHPFADMPVTITSLLVEEHNILWIGTSDGVVYCSLFDCESECSSLVKLKKVRLHCAGGASSLLWEPYTDRSTGGGEGEWQRINGVLTSVCRDTGLITQSEVFDFSDLVTSCCPLSIEAGESAGHRMFVKACVCLSQLNLLVVVDEASDVTLWSLLTGVIVLELNTEAVKGKIISVASYEFLRTDKYMTNFILFFGLSDGTMYACFVSRYESQLMPECHQSTSFSVLDLLGTLSKLPSRVAKDDEGSLMGAQDADTLNSSALDEVEGVQQVPASWEISFSVFAADSRHPPLPVSDVFVSVLGQHVCVCYARCSLYTYAIDTGALMLHVDLQHENVCDASQVVSVRDTKDCGDSLAGWSASEQDALVLALLGRGVLKLFDALTGVILTEVGLEDTFQPGEGPSADGGDSFQFCGVWDLTARQYSDDYVGILAANSGNIYAFGNISPLVLVCEGRSRRAGTGHQPGDIDFLPMNVKVFDIWRAFIVTVQFMRSVIVFKFDMRENYFSMIKSQSFDVRCKKASVVHVYPLEGDYLSLTPRVVLVLSDGATFTFNM